MERTTRKLFVAGSTGATGRVLVPMAVKRIIPVVAHVRPATAAKGGVPPNAAVLDLADAPALTAAMQGCTTVLQLIGTMRHRFASGDTYETSDIGTTAQLITAAKAAGVDHFVLLGSAGTGRPIGAYLKAKAKVEQLVRDSGIPYTIFRPSALEGGERKPVPGLKGITRLFGLKSFEPITLEELSSAMLKAAVDRAPLNAVLEGQPLWDLVTAR